MVIGGILAGLVKFTQVSLNAFRGRVEHVISVGKYGVMGKSTEGFFYGGTAASPALLGVGYIIGPRIASFVLAGGLLSWGIITPIVILAAGMPVPVTPEELSEAALIGRTLWGFYKVWGEQVRYIGVGAMVVGGLWTLWTLRTNLTSGIKEAIIGFKGVESAKVKKRTDRDIEYKRVFLAIGSLVIPILILYAWLSKMLAVSAFMAVLLVIVAFIGSAIAGYMAGLLGSSNNPISGVTVAVLLFVSLLMLGFGATGASGMMIVIGMAAVVCCAAAISGDVLQSLACGQMIGATPWKQQVAEIIGVCAAAPILALVVSALHKAYVIGSADLPAPQAFLMGGVVSGVMTGEMLWPYVIAGAILALILIIMDLPVLPVAIGTYLPFYLAVPIFIGGIIRLVVDRIIEKRAPKKEEEISDWEAAIKKIGVTPREKAHRTGLIFAAGLIAGEALMGVICAFLMIGHVSLKVFEVAPSWPGMLIWCYIAFLLGYVVLREFFKAKKDEEKAAETGKEN
jgi:putative OPT family oligopeptide transporter